MGDDGCAAGRGATPSEIVWVLAPVIAIICAMAFFGARRFGLVGGRPAAADRRPEAFAADLVVSHPLKVIALNVWLITALSVSAFVDVGCGELRESIDVLLDVRRDLGHFGRHEHGETVLRLQNVQRGY